MRRDISAAFAILRRLRWVALAAAIACGAPARPPPSFLILSIDTLRADHLGCYGYERDTSPGLDRFAADAIRYENAYAPAPWTLPSHAAMLTGHHPYGLGIVDSRSSLPPETSPVSVPLQRAGYQTAAFVDSAPGGLLGARRGFARGFDVFEHAPHSDRSSWRYDMAETVDAGLAWLASRDRERPFLLFLHTKSVHTAPGDPERLAESQAPYDKPLPFRTLFVPTHRVRFAWSRDSRLAGVNYLRDANERIARGEFDRAEFPDAKLEELVGLYDGGIYYVDHHFTRLLSGIEELGLSDDTVVIVTADHGEAFLDHLFFLHKEVYSGLLRVPLILRDPRDPRAGVVRDPVGLVDVVPTILALAGLEAPPGLDGAVLPRGGAGSPTEEARFSFFEFGEDYFYRAYSLHEGRWKLVHHKLEHWPDFRTELYDTDSDPGERRPVGGDAERKREMLARLLAWTESERATGSSIEIDPESAEQLRALGYLK